VSKFLFTPSLSAVKGWEGDPFPTDKDVARIVDTLPSLHAKARRSIVIDTLRMIRKYSVTHPGSERRQLLKAVKILKKAHDILAELPLSPSVAGDLMRKLARIRDGCKQRAGKMTVKHSGGRIIEAARKKIAAESALTILLLCGEKPTLSRSGSYLKLATLLFEVATGKRVNLERVCAKCCAEAEADGYQTPRRKRKAAAA
jgi:hypothetical protein